MGGMQVGGRAYAPMTTTVGGQQGSGQATQSPTMGGGATGTQAAEGAALTGGGGAEGGGKGRGRGRGRGGRGGEGFQLPPGLAGRSYEQLPPGIRKKMGAPPQGPQAGPQQGGCAMHGGTGTPGQVDGATGATAPAKPAKPTAEQSSTDAAMEQYLRDLAAGRVTQDQQPAGFQEWARRQMIEGTGVAAATPPASNAAPSTAAPTRA